MELSYCSVGEWALKKRSKNYKTENAADNKRKLFLISVIFRRNEKVYDERQKPWVGIKKSFQKQFIWWNKHTKKRRERKKSDKI